MTDPEKPPSDDSRPPVSAEIRARIVSARQRFHANDNISAFLEPGDLEALLDEVAEKMQGVRNYFSYSLVGGSKW